MTITMKLFIGLWIITITRMVGAMMAARHCLRIRKAAKNRTVYEWFTAFGIGLGMYSFSDFMSVWNGMTGITPQIMALYSPWYLFFGIIFALIQTLAVWIITLVLMNGGTPGIVRRGIFRILRKLKMMEDSPLPIPSQLDSLAERVEVGIATVVRTEIANAKVATNLQKAQKRADDHLGEPGEAADQAAITPPK